MHAQAPLLDQTPVRGERGRRPDPEREVMARWASSFRAYTPSRSVWQRLLRSIDADEAALS